MPARLLAYLRAILTRRRAHAEADDELVFHVEQETAANIERGLAPAEARRAALAALGGLTQTRESVRDVRQTWIERWIDDAWRDTRYGVRVLLGAPVFLAATMLVIGLGVGMNVAVFSAIRATLLADQPYADAATLVRMWRTGPRIRPTYFMWDDLDPIRRGAPALQAVEGAAVATATIRGDSFAESTAVDRVTAGFFALFGVRPLLGRPLGPADFSPSAHNVVITEATWRTHFARSPDVVGRTLHINQEAWVVVGVMPASFTPTAMGSGTDSAAWIPYAPRTRDSIGLYGRLVPGATFASAATEVADVMKARLAGFATGTLVLPIGQYEADRLEPTLLLLQTLAALLLIAAIVSLTNLFLAQASARQREIAVRSALGAGRLALVRQLLAEAGLIGIASGAAALVVSAAVLAAVAGSIPALVLPERLSRSLSIGAPELLLAFVLSWVVAVVAGPSAAWFGARSSPTALIHDVRATASRSARTLRDVLVCVQVLVAVVLLSCASLLVNSFVRALAQPVGFVSEGLISADIRMPTTAQWTSDKTRESLAALSSGLADRLHGLPFALASRMPFGCCEGTMEARVFAPDGSPSAFSGNPSIHRVDRAYFALLGIQPLAGRVIGDQDRQGSPPVAVVNEAFAADTGLGPNVVGSDVELGARQRFTVVGVVPNVTETRLSFQPRGGVYVPLDQSPASTFLGVAVRAGDVALVDRAVREAVRAVTPDGAVTATAPLTTKLVASEDQRRFYVSVSAMFGLASLVLAVVAIYGVTAQGTAFRRKEVGIRLALGARPAAVRRLFVAQGMRAVIAGLAGGLIAAWWATRALASTSIFKQFAAQLFHLTASDPTTLGTVVVGLATLGVVACWIPARRASRLDPAAVLRRE
jgi:predicted permease